MLNTAIFFGIILALSFILFMVMMLAFSSRMNVPGRMLIALLFGATFVYTFGYTLELGSTSLAYKIFFNHFQYFGLVAIAPLWFLVSIKYKDKKHNWTRKELILIFLIPVATIVANLTFVVNGFFYSSYHMMEWDNFTILVLEKGVWYYVNSVYTNLLEILTIINFYRVLKHALGTEKKQAILLIVLSCIGFVLTLSGYMSPYTSYIDTGAIALSLSSILLVIALFKYELFDLLPLAYYSVFESSDYPIIILSDSMRYIKSNAVAQTVFANLLKDKAGLSLADIFKDEPEFIRSLEQKNGCFISRSVDGEQLYFSARLISLGTPKNKKRKESGYLLVFHDETSHVHQLQGLKDEASLDPLTGTYNRRYFYKYAERIIRKAKSEERSVSFIMFDIDRFKTINDTYGHQAGDYVLKTITDLVRNTLRESDLLARYGGEEFLILLPYTQATAANVIAERICTIIRDYDFWDGDQAIKVTVSAGVSTLESSANLSLEDCIALADSALYRAKEYGRNRVCSAMGYDAWARSPPPHKKNNL